LARFLCGAAVGEPKLALRFPGGSRVRTLYCVQPYPLTNKVPRLTPEERSVQKVQMVPRHHLKAPPPRILKSLKRLRRAPCNVQKCQKPQNVSQPGLHPKAAKAASYNRYMAHPSAKHEWKRCRKASPLICESLGFWNANGGEIWPKTCANHGLSVLALCEAPPPHFKAIASSSGLDALSGCPSGLCASERSHAESLVS
jgi:hypothetical protein